MNVAKEVIAIFTNQFFIKTSKSERQVKKRNFLSLLVLMFISLYASVAFVDSATLSWGPPITNADGTTLSDLAGYKVYYGTSSGNYSQSIDVGNVTTYTVDNLTEGTTYYFATTAYDTSGNESNYSNEASFMGPTAVNLKSFTATYYDNRGVLLEWSTSYEVDNLGFLVYREEGGHLYKLTPEILAGSAFFVGTGTALTAGRHYVWWDTVLSPQSSLLETVKYWIEDIDLNGTRTMHGPVEIKQSSSMGRISNHLPVLEKQSEFLSDLGIRLEEKYSEYWAAQELRKTLSLNRSATKDKREENSGIALLEASAPQGNEVPAPSSLNSQVDNQVQSTEQDRKTQWFLASRPAVKLSIKEEGWYRATQPELIAAGLNPSINPQYLQLFVEGREQPIYVTGEKDKRFDPQDAIEFYGVSLDTPSTDTKTYWLVEGSNPGKRILTAREQRAIGEAQGFPYTVERKERTIYFPALKNGDESNFFGPVIAGEPVDQILTVLHPDLVPPGDALLEVSIQGVTSTPHSVKILFNDTEVGEVTFDGQSSSSASFAIPHSWLLEEKNLVTLISHGGETDVSMVDSLRLTYWHTYTADNDALKFTTEGGKQISINGFRSQNIRVFDITNPEAVFMVVGRVKAQGSGYYVTFNVSGTGQRTLLALTKETAKIPDGIVANQPSLWHQSSHSYDFVVITHKDLFESLQPLKNLRESKGFSVALIDVEDLYDEFSFGAKNPQAVREFLKLTKEHWSKAPRFVLLAGDASFDPRNYLGFGHFDFVPTKLIETLYLETASDDWFADIDGDGLPEMAVGRLPVRTAEEATTVVSKIMGYEQAGLMNEALLVSDKNDVYDFEAASEEIATLLPPYIKVKEIFRSNFSSNAIAKEELLSSIDQGPLLVNYTGHGSVEIWRGSILTSDDAHSLINSQRLPFFVNMTCLNGFFHDLYTESLAEALLKAKQGGAVAVWASSGLTQPDGQAIMNKELYRLLFNGESLTLGEATMKAKASVSDQDIRKTWILFGDPTTRLKVN